MPLPQTPRPRALSTEPPASFAGGDAVQVDDSHKTQAAHVFANDTVDIGGDDEALAGAPSFADVSDDDNLPFFSDISEESETLTPPVSFASAQTEESAAPLGRHSAPPAPTTDSGYDAPYAASAPVNTPEVPTAQSYADAPAAGHTAPQQAATTEFSPRVQDSISLLLQALRSDESSEVIMNGPNEVMIKKEGARYHIPGIEFGDADTYHRVLNEVILPHTDTADRITPNAQLVEGQLELPPDDRDEPPVLARVFIVAPPVTRFAKVTIAKKAKYSYNIDDLASKGSMTRDMAEFLKAAAYGRLTMVFSGLSGAGKTTMLEAASHYFDQNDRVIVIEDLPELRLPIADTVYLAASSNRPNMKREDIITMEWLVRATNRMRPDRIVVGEIRGGEMSEFLIAANSGADGSMTTVHADNPRRTLDKILSLSMRAEGAKSELSVSRDIASTVQLIVQLGLIDGKHVVTHIEEVSNTIRTDGGAIATTTLFEYDRGTGRHVPRNRPSEQMVSFLANRGVNVDMAWFSR